MKRLFLVPAFGVAALGLAAPVDAQTRGWLDTGRSYSAPAQASAYDSRRIAYDNGFREGLKEGEKDGRKNDRFAYEDEKSFRRADKGYHREYGQVDRYRQSFRTGYVAGYSEGYRRYARGYGSIGADRARSRRDSRRPDIYSDRRSYPGYPDRAYGRYGGYSNIAVENGVSDGYEKGTEDARKNRSFDPLRHAWYRSGDRHYENRYGSREQYKNLYRDGFRDGYERGFREGRYR
jgi:flagellar biosynthesis/type III secretory pathway protein FliH